LVLTSSLMLSALAVASAHAATPQEIIRQDAATQTTPSLPGIFGAIELRTNAARGAERWPEVMARATAERLDWLACERGSANCPPKLKAWRDGLAKARNLSRWQQIVEVNRLVNSLVRFSNDIDRYGVADYWATPKEALSKSGDCEDYAILKYLSLRELGFEHKDMRMVVVKITSRGIGHAVLAVNHDGGRYILDNLAATPIEHSVVKEYRPIYSVNSRGEWLALQVKPATTQVASLELVLSSSREPVAEEAAKAPVVTEVQGLKLPEAALLALGWDEPVTTPLPAAGWTYALSRPASYSTVKARAAYQLPRI